MTLRSQLMIGVLAMLSLPVIAFASDSSSTGATRVYNQAEIAYIYNLNCDIFTGDALTRCLDIKRQALVQSSTNSGSIVPPIMSSGSIDPRPMMSASGMMMSSGSMLMSRSTMGSGSMMDVGGNGLILAMGQLSVADREALTKMIREYLISKGVDPSKYAEKREEIKEVRKDTHEEIKNARAKALEAARAKREEMRKKVRSIRTNTIPTSATIEVEL